MSVHTYEQMNEQKDENYIPLKYLVCLWYDERDPFGSKRHQINDKNSAEGVIAPAGAKVTGA